MTHRTLNRARLIVALVIGGWLLAYAPNAQAQPGDQPVQVTAEQQTDIIDSLCEALNQVYIFADVAADMEKLVRKNLKSGDYKDLTSLSEFTRRLTDDFRSVSHDRHLGVSPSEMRTLAEDDPEEKKRRQEEYLKMMRADNYAFKKIELLPGNIGYLRFDGFQDAEYGGATAVAAMNFLANADAIIFDMRFNGGGSPSMIQLITSYLVDEATHINSFYIRKDDTTRQFWTQAHVIGPRMADVPAYVLTSRRTFSAAEEFTYNLKNMERATIVGDTTGGGAHPVEGHWFRISDEVFVDARIPYGRAINPISGTNWEGTGVAPDIVVPADQALLAAQRDFLQKSLETTEDEGKRFAAEWSLKGLEVALHPVTIDSETLGEYVGVYGPRQISLDDGDLYYQREDRPRYRLIPMGGDMFAVDGLDFFRIQFEHQESGVVYRIVGMYDNGETDQHDRVES